ncbi:ABC transporter substrate-binding protein [Acuticoccus sp. MNP-M23]|uniref:ABC transporter substrate-binding protein n=1 Tax=Acuticoccus sp. MNP-M23 TaxID=3072793 RepID=UPI002814E15D|nr:ABC transporter substrate-binding protein [Acuticoccus sp. MNP-M23]WMS42532.1 ABC transporter substrate-binding protein [Acuticoccus sp. MNP-M23]
MDLTIALEKVDFVPPERCTDDASLLTLKTLALEPLLTWSNGRVGPGLFHRLTHDGTGRRWRFEIRPGATFHDGKPCRAADILAFIEAILVSRDGFGMTWAYADYLAGTTLSAPSDNVVEADTAAPFADLPEIFSEFFVARADENGHGTIGTGRWRVEMLAPGEHTVLEAGGRRLSFRAMPDAAARLRAVTDGTVDAALNLERVPGPPVTVPSLIFGEALNTLSVMAYFNCRKGPFADPELRRAANLAVDRDRLVRDVFHGRAAPASTVVSPFHHGMANRRVPPFPYNLAEARRIVGDQRPVVTLRTPTHMPDRAPEIAQAVADDLRAAGFDVTVDLITDRPAYARQIGEGDMGDLALFDSSPHSTYRILQDKVSAIRKGTWWQGYHNDAADRLIEAAARAVDDDDRCEAYAAALDRLVEDPPWLFLVHPVEVFAARKGINGLSLDNKGVLNIA